MAGIPGIGPASVVGLIGKMIYDEVRISNIHATINNTDPRQKVIEAVLDEMYAWSEIFHLDHHQTEQEREEIRALRMTAPGLSSFCQKHKGQLFATMPQDYYNLLVSRYCKKHRIAYNPYSLKHHDPKIKDHGWIGSRDEIKTKPDAVDKRVKAEINAYNVAAEVAQEAYDALPTSQKILNSDKLGFVIGFGLVTLFIGWIATFFMEELPLIVLGIFAFLAYCWYAGLKTQ